MLNGHHQSRSHCGTSALQVRLPINAERFQGLLLLGQTCGWPCPVTVLFLNTLSVEVFCIVRKVSIPKYGIAESRCATVNMIAFDRTA